MANDTQNGLKTGEIRGRGTHVGCRGARPATGYNAAYYIIEQRKRDELQRKNEENQKVFSLQNCKNKFEEVTERKNISSTLKNMVDAGMKAVYYDLEDRKDKLRNLLTKEEACYKRERYERAMNMEHQAYVEKRSQAEDRRRQREEDRKKLVDEKRTQQFLSNYDPIRTMFTMKNNKQTFCAQLEQIKEAQEQHYKELAEEAYWKETDRKILEKKIEEEEIKSRETKKKMQDIAKELLRQQAEKENLREQEEAMKTGELMEIEKLKEKARLEEIEELKQHRAKREAFQNILKKQIEEHEEVLAKQNESETLSDQKIAEGANETLRLEHMQRKKLMEEKRKEMLYYKEYMEELKKVRIQEDERFDELVETQRKYLDKQQEERICQEKEARNELTKQVLVQRKLQIEEREKARASQKELQVIEAQLAERRRLENLRSQEEESYKSTRAKTKYAIELQKQMEHIQQMKEREKEEADRLLKKGLMEEKEYLQKAEEILNTRISKKIHPFQAAINNEEIPADCMGTF